jgi:hypothetical protein
MAVPRPHIAPRRGGGESGHFDVETAFGGVRVCRFETSASSPGPAGVLLHSARAAARARNLLPRGQVELWGQATHAINGEHPTEIAESAHRFWDEVDGG